MVNEPDEESSQSRSQDPSLNPSTSDIPRKKNLEEDRPNANHESPDQDSDHETGVYQDKPPHPPASIALGPEDDHSGRLEQEYSQGTVAAADEPESNIALSSSTAETAPSEPAEDRPTDDHRDHEHYPHGTHRESRHPEEEEEDWNDEGEDEGGGPVKSFLEHLEDLRWVIIRSVVAILIAMVVCLAAANKVVDLLKEPLANAQKLAGKTQDFVVLVQTSPASTNFYTIKLKTNQFGAINLGTNQAIKLVMEPLLMGTNMVMGLHSAPATEEEIPYDVLVSLKNMGPISPFVVALKIALFGGIGLASPFVLFFIGQFVVPALHRHEKKYLYQALAIGVGLFCTGVAFCYFAMLQIALNAAMKFSKWMNFEPDIWRAEEYISFVVKFLLGMGLSFELPVVLLTLVKLELLDYERMKKFRPYWVVVNLVIAALLTPPDVVSQLLMAIPLQVLYEISVLIAWYWHKRDQKRLQEDGYETE